MCHRHALGEEVFAQFALVASRLSRISGVVVDADGRPAGNSRIMVITQTAGGYSSSAAGLSTADGTFTLNRIAPGEHSLTATQQVGDNVLTGSAPVTADGTDITGFQIRVGRGATLSGRVTYDVTRTNKPADLTGALPITIRIRATPAELRQRSLATGGSPQADGTIRDDGTFTLGNLSGRVFLSLQPQIPGAAIKSVMLDGRDVTDVPLNLDGVSSISGLQVTITDKVTTVNGTPTLR